MTQNDRTWLTLWAWGVVIFGVVLATFALPAIDGAGRMVFDLIGNPAPAAPDAHLRFSVGLMGCVTIGWGVTYFALFRAAWALPVDQARPVWRMTLLGSLAWFVPDSILSVVTGFPMNVLPNIVLLILLVIPLARSGMLKGA